MIESLMGKQLGGQTEEYTRKAVEKLVKTLSGKVSENPPDAERLNPLYIERMAHLSTLKPIWSLNPLVLPSLVTNFPRLGHVVTYLINHVPQFDAARFVTEDTVAGLARRWCAQCGCWPLFVDYVATVEML